MNPMVVPHFHTIYINPSNMLHNWKEKVEFIDMFSIRFYYEQKWQLKRVWIRHSCLQLEIFDVRMAATCQFTKEA